MTFVWLVTHFLLLGDSAVGTEVATYANNAITLVYTIPLSTTTTYSCKATKTDDGVTEATVNIFKTG